MRKLIIIGFMILIAAIFSGCVDDKTVQSGDGSVNQGIKTTASAGASATGEPGIVPGEATGTGATAGTTNPKSNLDKDSQQALVDLNDALKELDEAINDADEILGEIDSLE